MMTHWSKRLRTACTNGRISYAELARMTGISEDSINKYVQGAVDQPRGTTVDVISKALGVSKLWLLHGVGESHGGSVPESLPRTVNIPFFSFKAGMGGGGVISDERPEDFWPVPQTYLRHIRLDTADLVTISVEGDSMSPTLESGDQILIDQSDKNPVRGGIFAIHDSDTLVVKRIEKIPNSEPVKLKLISDNPHHNAYEVLADTTAIIGRVVWFARRM